MDKQDTSKSNNHFNMVVLDKVGKYVPDKYETR